MRTVVLTALGLLVQDAWAACNPDSNPDGCIDVKCQTDDTILVNIGYYLEADILGITYGDCTAAHIDGADQQNTTDLSWTLTLPIKTCNMTGIQADHTATVHVGKKREVGPSISLAHFEIDAKCEFKNTYELIFDYGLVDTTMEKFDDDAGKISVDIQFKSYNSDFSSEETNTEQAGAFIYLGITINDANFNHADSLWGSDVGKIFTPRKCIVEDVSNGLSYLLFDMELSCSNYEIDLTVGWEQDKHMWTITHILFLLGSVTESTFKLRCMFHVCDVAHDTSKCAIAVKACFGVDGNWTDYGAWSVCSAQCGNGTQYRTRSCTNPTPDYAGRTCQGSSEETQWCNNGDCDPSFDLASVNECDPDNCANGHQCHDLLGDYACGNDVFGTYSCDRGWKGKNCDQEVNPCDDEPCHPDGAAVCKPLSSTEYTCYCHEGWRGETCDEPPMNLISVPGTFTAAYTNMDRQALNDAGIEDILKEEIEKLARSEGGLGRMVQEIKDWSFSYTTNGNDTTLDVEYTTVITVIQFEVWEAVEEPTRRKRNTQQAEPDYDETQQKYVENKMETVNSALNDPASDVNQALAVQVPSHRPVEAISDTGSISVTTDLDACAKDLHSGTSPCQNGGVCKDFVGAEFADTNIPVVGRDFECECGAEIDYEGDFCDVWSDDCDPNPCENGGTCNDGLKAYTCTCPTFEQPTLKEAPFSGMHCGDIDNPCENGGMLEFDSVTSKPVCTCSQKYQGELCTEEKDTDACGFPEALCMNGGVCVDKTGGFLGNPNITADYTCECDTNADYGGDICEDVIDDCVNHQCLNGATCVDGVRSYTCECADFSSDPLIGQSHPTPYSGPYCETLVNPCNNGNLQFDVNTTLFECNCDLDWEGDFCDVSLLPPILNACNASLHDSVPCMNGGKCVDSAGGFNGDPVLGTDYSCNCDAVDFDGDVCENHIDDCDGIVCKTWQRCVDGVRKHACENEMCSVDLDKPVNLVKLDASGNSTTDTDFTTVNHLDYCNNPFNPINELDSLRQKSCSDLMQAPAGYRFEHDGTVLFDENSGDFSYAALCPRNCKTCVSRAACNSEDHQDTHKMVSDAFDAAAATPNFCKAVSTECSNTGSETFTDCSGAAFRRNGELIAGKTDSANCTTWEYKKLCPVKCGGCRYTHSICSDDIDSVVEMVSTADNTPDASFHNACGDDYWTANAVTCDTVGTVGAGSEIVRGVTTLKTEFDGVYSFAEICPRRCERCVECPAEYDVPVTMYNRTGHIIDAYDNYCAKRCTSLTECACNIALALQPGHYFSRGGRVIATRHDNGIKESYELCPKDCEKCSASVQASHHRATDTTVKEEEVIQEEAPISGLWGRLAENSGGSRKRRFANQTCPTKTSETDVCQSIKNTMPKFSIDLNNPGKSDFCEFMQMLPTFGMWAFGVCDALRDCVVASLKANTFAAKDCISGLFSNSVTASKNTFKNVGQKMANMGSSVLDLGEDLACSEDPTTPLEMFLETLPQMIEMFSNIGNQVKDYIQLIVGTWSGTPTDPATLKEHLSILLSKDVSFTAGTNTRTHSQGIFATFRVNDIKDYVSEGTNTDGSIKMEFNPSPNDLMELVKKGEYGYWEAVDKGQTSDKGAQIGFSGTAQLLQGTKADWSKFGFDIAMGMDLDIGVVEAGATIGMVFGADEQSDGSVTAGKFLGFSTSIGLGFGPTEPLPVSLSVGCAYTTAFSSDELGGPRCPALSINEEVRQVANNLVDLGKRAVDLGKKCVKAALCNYEPCEPPLKNWLEGQKQCPMKDMFRECLTWKNAACLGDMVVKGYRCAKYGLKQTGKCISGHFRSFCSSEKPVEKCEKKSTDKWWQKLFKWICRTVVKCLRWASQLVTCVVRAWVSACVGEWEEVKECATDLVKGCTSWAQCQFKNVVNAAKNMYSCTNEALDAVNINPFKAVCGR